ncbi:hypothetical protein Dimus_005521 [Dionaea muscipula]
MTHGKTRGLDSRSSPSAATSSGPVTYQIGSPLAGGRRHWSQTGWRGWQVLLADWMDYHGVGKAWTFGVLNGFEICRLKR